MKNINPVTFTSGQDSKPHENLKDFRPVVKPVDPKVLSVQESAKELQPEKDQLQLDLDSSNTKESTSQVAPPSQLTNFQPQEQENLVSAEKDEKDKPKT